VIEGLGGQIGSRFQKSEIRTLLANLKKRTFFLKSAHLEDIRLFTTRWVLSYLKGPLKKKEIAKLMERQKSILVEREKFVPHTIVQDLHHDIFQQIDPSILQYFEPDPSQEYRFNATIGAKVSVRFYNQRRGIDEVKQMILSLPLYESMQRIDWCDGYEDNIDFENYPHTPPKRASFSRLPDIVLKDKKLKGCIKELKEFIYSSEVITLWRCERPKIESVPGESKADFMIRFQDFLEEKKEEEIDKLKERYGKKEKTLFERLRRAQERVEKEEADSTSTLIETGIAVLGALFGKTSATKIGRAVNKGGKILKERGEMSRAQERVVAIKEDIEILSDELEGKIDQLYEKYNIENYSLKEIKIKPRKTDIDVENCAVVWRT
jgi:hypothetical protein